MGFASEADFEARLRPFRERVGVIPKEPPVRRARDSLSRTPQRDLTVPGVGTTALERYGEVFRGVIARHRT